MVRECDVIYMSITDGIFKLCKRMARLAEIGGKSHVYEGSAEERSAKLSEDQLIGQLGTLAAIAQITGSSDPYIRARREANENPTVGDGGSDIGGVNVDVKTSLKRHVLRSPLDYNLLVRPAELHEDWVYVLCLVTRLEKDSAIVAVIGWAHTHDLPSTANLGGAFDGAFVLPARLLNPMPPLVWPNLPYAV